MISVARELLYRQEYGQDDANYEGSTLSELQEALFDHPYCDPWPGVGKFRWPTYQVTLGTFLRGINSPESRFGFLSAARRIIDSKADLRWGQDGLGYRRLLHPNGICLFGKWIIDQETEYTGYFAPNSEGVLVARYSTCCTNSKNDKARSLSLVGKLFPTKSVDDPRRMIPANFITQEDLGGSFSRSIKDVELRNAPDTTFYRRGWGAPILLLTGLTFLIADREPAFRQLYEIAELDKPGHEETRSPRFMRLTVANLPNPIDANPLDFRDEIMAQIYDANNVTPQRVLSMEIEVTDQGKTYGPLPLQRRTFKQWRRIGRIEFTAAAASYNGDFVAHFHHPAWRIDERRADTAIRQERQRTKF